MVKIFVFFYTKMTKSGPEVAPSAPHSVMHLPSPSRGLSYTHTKRYRADCFIFVCSLCKQIVGIKK
jgi:hypothetical protein